MGWVTINGARVFIDDKKRIVAGPANLMQYAGRSGDGGLYDLRASVSLTSSQVDYQKGMKEARAEVKRDKARESARAKLDAQREAERKSEDPKVVERRAKLDAIKRAEETFRREGTPDSYNAWKKAQSDYHTEIRRSKESDLKAVRKDPTKHDRQTVKTAFKSEISKFDSFFKSKNIPDVYGMHTDYFINALQRGFPPNEAAKVAIRQVLAMNKK